jgi:predicted permease
MNQFVLGALVMASGVIGLFFLRFWRKTRDRLFVFFAAAFWLLGANWLLLAWVRRDEAQSALLYAIRLMAFGLILVGIWSKNRSQSVQASEQWKGQADSQ